MVAKCNKVSSKRQQRGFSLVELMIVLGISAVLILGVYSLYTSIDSSQETQTEAQNIQAIATKIKSIYAGRNTYTGLATANIVTANGFPMNMLDGTTPYNAWGGAVTTTINATAGFDITYPDVPAANCQELVNAVANMFRNITIGATAVKTAGALNAATLATTCNAAGPFSIVFNAL